jgi:MraZ protein
MAHYNFTGEFSCSLDAKNRFNIPSAIRKMVGPEANDTLIFAPGFEQQNLYVYPLDEWKRLTDSFKKFKPNDVNAQNFIRFFVSGAHTVTMDTQGRIMLPARILEMAQIKSELLILGMVNKMEVWNPEKYSEFRSKIGLNLSQLVKEINFSDLNYDEEER